MDKSAIFHFRGDSICEWAKMVDEFEQKVHYDGQFEFSICEIVLNPVLLRKLRCLSVADYEVAERTNTFFRRDVIMPLLEEDERKRFLFDERFIDFLKREWNISSTEIESAGDVLVSLKWLMSKQSHRTLNTRMHQAFDYIQVFYDICSLEYSEDSAHERESFSEQFNGLFDRYHKETIPWIRFAKGDLIMDFLEGLVLSFEEETQRQVNVIREEYAGMLLRWTQR